MTEKRITELDITTTLASDDYLPVDNYAGTTRRIKRDDLRNSLGVVDASTTEKGIVKLITNALIQLGVNDTDAVTTSALASLFNASSRLLNGYIRIPVKIGTAFEEIIIQWGEEASFHDISDTYNATLTFPITFPNQCLKVIPSMINNTLDNDMGGVSARNITTSNFIIQIPEFTTAVNSVKGSYIAIGY